MRYGSICSGIEAATVAWHHLGWQPAFFSEIDRFPCEVLAHHYGSNLPGEVLARNGVPNLGDMTKFQEWPDHAIDLLVGGTPCQSFSVAGLRAGLADPRGNLMLTYLAIAARYRPRWLVWENVPGVLSSGDGRDFGTFLQGLGELGYGFAYRVLDAQFVRVDGFPHAVPQRRRRVFVVGYLGDWRRAAAVFFDGASLRGDSAPSRKAGQGLAPTISARTKGGGGLGTDFDLDGGLIAAEVASTLPAGGNATGGNRQPGTGAETAATMLVAHALRAEGFDASEDGTGRGTPIVPVVAASLTRGAESSGKGGYAGRRQEDDSNLVAQPIVMMERGRNGEPTLETRQDGTANAILTPNGGRGGLGVGAIPFDTTQITSKANRSVPKGGDPCHPLAAGAHPPAIAFNPQAGGKQTTQGFDPESGTVGTLEVNQTPAVAWSIMPQNSGKDYKARQVDVAQPLMAGGPVGGNQGGDYIQQQWAVRRLTPKECERLQGFPDGYTDIPRTNGKAAADGPRYKALGNSMAVNAMSWIGERIAMVEAMKEM